jgi:molecular chaperone DnaK (HSP70)
VCRLVRSETEAYTAEELNAMLLSYVKQIVSEHTGKSARRCVISVPAFFADSDRRALLAAAKICGLEVVSLVNDGLAVALKYATDNLQLTTLKGVHRVLFFDMGATGTQATVVEFRGHEGTSPTSSPPSPPSIRVLGAAWDSSLGGSAFTDRIVDLLAKGSLPKTVDLSKDARALARLRKEANRAKHVLSANKETLVTVEDIIGDHDIKELVTRGAFEEHCSDLLERVCAPVTSALHRAGNLTLEQLDAFEMVGGGWRIPSVQETLSSCVATHKLLGKSLNADEAACSGAALLALYLTHAGAGVKMGPDLGYGVKKSRAGVPALIEDVVAHDVIVMVDTEIVAVMPAGKPLLVLGGSQAPVGIWTEDEEGFTVMMPVAVSKDFIAKFLYTREPGAQPFAAYMVTGVEAALAAARGKASSARGGGDSAGGGSQSVELHVKVSRDGTVSLFRAVFVSIDTLQRGEMGAGAGGEGGEGGESAAQQAVIGVAAMHTSVMGGGGPIQGLGGVGPVELVLSSWDSRSPGAGGGGGWGALVGWGGGRQEQPRVVGMTAADVKRSFGVLVKLEKKEGEVKKKDEKCNFLESSAYMVRETLEKPETALLCKQSDMRSAEEAAKSIVSWLESHRETATIGEIQSKLDELEAATVNMFMKLEAFARREQEVEEGSVLLQKGRQLLMNLTSRRYWLKMVSLFYFLAARYCRLFVRIWAWVGLAETVGFVVLGLGDDYVHFVRQMRLFAAHPFAPYKFSTEDRKSLFEAYNLDRGESKSDDVRGASADGEGFAAPPERAKDPETGDGFRLRMVYDLLDHVQLGSADAAADGLAGFAGREEEENAEEEELWGALVLGEDSESDSSLTSDDLNSGTFGVARGRFGMAGGGRGIERWCPRLGMLVRWLLPARWTRKINKVAGQWIWKLKLWHMCVGQLPVTRVLAKSVEDWCWIHVMPRLFVVPRLGSWLAWFVGVHVDQG